MSRIQLALNVNDIDAAVVFYTKLFGTEPAKVRPGYANFAIAEPPLKLVLIENPGAGGTLNHLGVEMMSIDEVGQRLADAKTAGLTVREEGEVECCYARQDKGWIDDPDNAPWEFYTVLGDAPAMEAKSGCCVPAAESVTVGASPSAAGCC